MKAFNLEEALAGKPVVTRRGTTISQVAFFKDCVEKGFPVGACVDGYIKSYTIDGKLSGGVDTAEDLFMASVKKKFYVNRYSGVIGGKTYNTLEAAQNAAKEQGSYAFYIETLEFEYEE